MAETAAIQTSYDEVPYESNPFPWTHPDQLAVVATLFGMQPPAPDRYRVLELGCASGGNLIPMALDLPASRFTGIDLSPRQIGDGRKVIEALGLTNIELQAMSILDVNRDFGTFDYIICHGVYSWVPREVQEKILAICAENLAPNGVAYVSYNTYPGWHLRGMIRDMMLYHARRFADPAVRVQQARALINFLAQSVRGGGAADPERLAGEIEYFRSATDSQLYAREATRLRKLLDQLRQHLGHESAYAVLLKTELDYLRKKEFAYLFHEYLEEVNEPVYFYQFAERAAARGLQYLGEVQISAMVAGNFGAEIEQTLRQISTDLIHMEQYMDFLRNRMFRRSLLCHQGIPITHTLYPDTVRRLHVSSSAQPVTPAVDLRTNAPAEFRGRDGVPLTTREPLMKAALAHLAAVYPQSVAFDELRQAARSRLDSDPAAQVFTMDRDVQILGTGILNCCTLSSAVGLHVLPRRCAAVPGERPVASPLARLQAERGRRVTNLRHESVELDEFARQVVRHLDGTRDRQALLEVVVDLVGKTRLTVHEDNQPVTDPARLRVILTQVLDQTLPRLAKYALLVE